MSVDSDLQVAVRLACLTEDRTDAEQRALLRVARSVDDDRNRNVVTNRRMWGPQAGSTDARLQRPLSDLEALVDGTRVVSDFPGDHQHKVALKLSTSAERRRQWVADGYPPEGAP